MEERAHRNAESSAASNGDIRATGQKAMAAAATHARTAGKVASLAAERTKISTVTLPLAYHQLGEQAYRARMHAEDFPDLYTKLDEVHARLADGKQRPAAGGDTVSEKAKAWAQEGLKMARSGAQGVQAKSLFVQLGKACFDKGGLQAAAQELGSKVQELRDRLAAIDAEITSTVRSTGGLKKWLMVGGGVLVCLVILGAFLTRGDASGTRRKGGNASSTVEQEAYEDGYAQGAETGRGMAEMVREAKARGANALQIQACIESLQQTAADFSEQKENAINAVTEFESLRGEQCTSPDYLYNRGRCSGFFDGYMSEVGRYLQ